MMVIFQTNVNEAWEYIGTIPFAISISLLMIIIISAIIIMRINAPINCAFHNLSKKRLFIFNIIAIIATYYTFASLFPRTTVIRLAINTQQYFSSIESYKTNRAAILDQLKVISHNKLTTPHTIILVIGESATRNYMRAFNPDNNLEETTPWLSQQKDNFILYNNAYACAWNTVPALEHALTEANYYNDKEFNKSISIIDIAKRAGYKTYWFSNQAKIGVHDTPITLVAETADVSNWGGIGTAYDEGLLPHLKSVNKYENNFIVLHLMGSHIDYDKRYPKQYQIWTDPNTTGRLADYKNSLVYTDKVLQDFFEYSKNILNLASFIYFSDHGTDPNRSRDPDETKFIGLRIPLFVYLSPEYQSQNISEAKALTANKERFFSNDLIYNLICGVLVVESNCFEPTESLASPSYKFNINNTKAGLGSKSVKDDPYL